MNPTTKKFLPALALLLSVHAGASMVPKGWFKTGSAPQLYDVEVMKNAGGKSAVVLRSIDPSASGFGTLMQVISADAYSGKRIRFSATVQADGIKGWAGLWTRVDGAQGKVLSFDNMQKRPITGTKDGRKYSVVVEVPKDAKTVSYGLLLNGAGAAVLWGVRVESVGKEVPLTAGLTETPDLPKTPQNLDFTE